MPTAWTGHAVAPAVAPLRGSRVRSVQVRAAAPKDKEVKVRELGVGMCRLPGILEARVSGSPVPKCKGGRHGEENQGAERPRAPYS